MSKPDPRKDDVLPYPEDEILSSIEIEEIAALRQEIPALAYYTDKFILRFLVACKMRSLNTSRKLRLYLKAKQEWGLEHGLWPVFENRIALPCDYDLRTLSSFSIRAVRDKLGRLIIWKFNERQDPLHNYDDPVNEMNYWLCIFSSIEIQSFYLTAKDIRAGCIEVSDQTGGLEPGKHNPSMAKLIRKTLAIAPMNCKEVFMIWNSLWSRLKARWKLHRVSKRMQIPWKVHIVSRRRLREYIDKKNLLSLLGGDWKFDWETDGVEIRKLTVDLERKAMDHWDNVRKLYHLSAPTAPKPRTKDRRDIYRELGSLWPGGLSPRELEEFLRDPAGNNYDVNSFTTK